MSIRTATESTFSSSSSSASEKEATPVEEVKEEVVQETGPQYTDDELNALVQRVKDFTMLFDLRDEDWTPETVETIKLYFSTKTDTVLSVFFDNVTLKATFGFPSQPVKDLTYFLKDSTDRITAENFSDTMMFGTTNESIEGSILSVLENIYAPIFFDETTWPDSIL
ncbi:hypothetical protein L9F63_008536 [Diploptera punctata]|uniref:Uncharacterized protein n=1 Tax=Diploptera punctata TaxID=6984 RepID=A0AAD8E2I9_DIPPU|nr:hypothetical protein L9F63_008536 [Diploptera punctata]